MDTIKNAASSVSETVQGSGATAQKEGNKSMRALFIPLTCRTLTDNVDVAEDSNQGLGTRATAAKDAVSNKMDEQKHEVGTFSRCLGSIVNILF
ncbi:MAG: hypothetical protein Q9226_000232 [Calogaya cf. arnoldii]